MSNLFYLQDTRGSGCVGNDLLFWKLGGGYTTDISKAEMFTKQSAFGQHACRDTDLPWPKEYLDRYTRLVVDIQNVSYDEAMGEIDNLIELEVYHQ